MHVAQSNIYLCSVAKDASFMIVAPYVTLCISSIIIAPSSTTVHLACMHRWWCGSIMSLSQFFQHREESMPFMHALLTVILSLLSTLPPRWRGTCLTLMMVVTALHWAAQKCQFPIVKYLVRSCGFDVKARDKVSHESRPCTSFCTGWQFLLQQFA